MNAGNLSGVATAVLLAIFLGGWAWAWSGRRRQVFDAAARLPLDDEIQERRP
jgi:cytochrome c oxidase cbb3-type subunit 4